MNQCEYQQNELKELLIINGASLVGFADVSDINKELTNNLPTAISFGIHYNTGNHGELDLHNDFLHEKLESLNAPIINLIGLTEQSLDSWGYQYYSIPIPPTITSNKQLESFKQFSHKTAATKAGLGWIGKSALLVTPEYGPRVKIYTVFTNAPFKPAKPITDHQCGNCTLCADICPCNAIKNVSWYPGIKIDQLIDIYACNEFRLSFKNILGRKHSCGLCIKTCKFGH